MKIAILSSYFQNSHATANGLCARNLYNELLCEHNQVKVVCYYAENADNRVNYGPTLENMLYIYACSQDCTVSVGRIGKLECDFIIRNREMNYSYVQIAYTIALSKETEDREYRPLEMIADNYPKYVLTTDYLLQKRNGILHENIIDYMREGKVF